MRGSVDESVVIPLPVTSCLVGSNPHEEDLMDSEIKETHWPFAGKYEKLLKIEKENKEREM